MRAALAAFLIALAVGVMPTAAQAQGVAIKTTYVGGLADGDRQHPFPWGAIAGTNPYCTADPNSLFYGTAAFNPASALKINSSQLPDSPSYSPANLPASTHLVRSNTAGSYSDFCVGFTLSPAAETWLIRAPGYLSGPRIADPNPYPDVPGAGLLDDALQASDADDARRVVIDLPAGYQGSPASVPQCDPETGFGISVYSNPSCPAASQVGDAYVRVNLLLNGGLKLHLPIPGTPIYNLRPGPNELALLGVAVQPVSGVAPVKFTIRLSLAPDGSGRIRAITDDIPKLTYLTRDIGAAGEEWGVGSGTILDPGDPRIGTVEPGAILNPFYMESVGIRSWGSAAAHPSMPANFGELASSCTTEQRADVQVDMTQGDHLESSATAPNLTGCDQLSFAPTVDVVTTERRPGVPTGVTVGVNLPAPSPTASRASALMQQAQVTLPEGLEVGGQIASGTGGLELCTASQFAASDALTPSQCPGGTKVGSVRITSPLITSPLEGDVFLGPQPAIGELPNLYLEAALPGSTAADAPRLKLVGRTEADQQTGAITATFGNLPPLRFSRLELTFPDGPNALFVTPPTCGTFTADSRFAPTSGQADAVDGSSILIDENCATDFAPTVELTHADATAGASSATRMTLSRPANSPWLTRSVIQLPSGFLANIGSVPECPRAQAQTGACPAASRIGTVTAYAGAGGQPLRLAGAMFLREYDPGETAGVVIVVRAKLGTLDLGNVVVPGSLRLRPTDAGITYESEIPTRLRGVALWLQRIDVDIDRAGFPLNPTSCGPLAYSATLSGVGGVSAEVQRQISYTGCEALPFAPSLQAIVTGDNRPGGYPGMYVLLKAPEGTSALKTAAVTLPGGVRVALKNLQNPCRRADFDAVRCPASTRIGSVNATVSVTDEVIRGDIFLIEVPGRSLPSLGLSFSGRYPQRVAAYTEVDPAKRVTVVFPQIPDLPLRQLEINVASGPNSPLEIPIGNCAIGTNWRGLFTGQGGQFARVTTGLQCADEAEVRLTERRGFTLRLFSLGSRKLLYAKAALPKGWRFSPSAVRRRPGDLWVRLTGSSARYRLTDRSITAYAKTPDATSVRIKIAARAIKRLRGAAKPGTKVVIPVRLAFTDGAVQTQAVRVTLE